MAETNQSVWHSIVRDKWRNVSEIHGDGPHACVNRCLDSTRVYLFSTALEAHAFSLKFCDAKVCWKKHSVGSLIPFVPALVRPRGDNMRAYLESEA
jgi:hypothetical protein